MISNENQKSLNENLNKIGIKMNKIGIKMNKMLFSKYSYTPLLNKGK